MLIFRGDSGDSPKQLVCSLGGNIKALVLRWRQGWEFKMNISAIVR